MLLLSSGFCRSVTSPGAGPMPALLAQHFWGAMKAARTAQPEL